MMLFVSSRSVFTLAAIAFALAACSSSTTGTSSGTSGSSGGVAASAADCASRCESKFTTCGADAASAKSNCSSQVCEASPTGDQLTCLENKSCDAIANSTGFASLCPAASTTTPPSMGATCGSATCKSTEYCSLSYDSAAMAWNPSACKAVPAACASKGASELCTCMADNSGCPTSGVISTKCNQSNGALSFGCK